MAQDHKSNNDAMEEKSTKTKKELQDMCTAANMSRSGNKTELTAKLKNCLFYKKSSY